MSVFLNKREESKDALINCLLHLVLPYRPLASTLIVYSSPLPPLLLLRE